MTKDGKYRDMYTEKVERILPKAIGPCFLYNNRMAKRVKGFAHISSQGIHHFLSVNS